MAVYSIDGRPDWQQIDTPWEPQPIVWRASDSYQRTDELSAYVANDPTRTHLVREIAVHEPENGYKPGTVARTEQILEKTEEELRLLGKCGLASAEVAWHVFTTGQTVRTLARVAIINGISAEPWASRYGDKLQPTKEMPTPSGQDYYELDEGISAYLRIPGKRICDYGSRRQYRYGVPRTTPNSKPQFHLIDPEPLQWSEWYS
jgi:hypothetical protein